ncbi:Aldehyde dehydrogenase N-terminal [Penicillium cosmopolitanum]|uniref:Succinate-semialdehyde dehydrogenase, mitochondrial n=1 Tax=Penicillium cosmopolitanum TaxID=1131564 RepID=A0A9X0B9B4_9EURO|nr:Aldehyde dehydrogenase N-terminal [Penicillium cosmopolitanum]KAJ5396558.1 Aldehyde dehydrogenase N-terminal [Penicillium cosmopolitanum]
MDTSSLPVALETPSLFDNRGFIAGKWRHASSNKTFPVLEPSTGRTLAQCADFSTQDFVEAIETADAEFKQFFSTTTAKQRGTFLRKWNDLILENSQDIAKILSLENGKTLAEAKGEVIYAASFVSWFAEEATRSYGDVIPSSYPNNTVMTFKEPVGVCGIITPWNFPAAMITRKIAPAFAAGCSVVIKPPSETPFTAIALVKLALLGGVPPGVVNIVPTKDRQASLQLATHPRVRKLSFTGSTNVGKMLTKLAADTMKRISMELGGNAPFIVFQDADLDKAVEGALICKFRSSGQTCVCANRLFVHESVLEEFTDRMIKRVKSFQLGRGIDEGVTHGPLVNAAAVEKVKSHVQDALDKGGRLRYGGAVPVDRSSGYFFEPTIITGAHKDMHVANDETFGPLAAIFSFSSEDEVVSLANDTEFGLAGYFFSNDINRIFRVSRRIECGMIGVNTGLISAAEAPFGGVKESGVGREGSKYGLAEYQNIKSVTIGGV